MNNTVSNLIKFLREDKGFTQSELAFKSKVPRSTIAEIERGANGPRLKTAKKLLKSLVS